MTLPPTDAEFDALQDRATSPDSGPTFGEVLQRRMGRRDVLRGALAGTALAAGLGPALVAHDAAAQGASASGAAAPAGGSFPFKELVRVADRTHHVAEGHQTQVLIRWGDPLFQDSPAFDPLGQTAAAQLRQFGYNNDFLGFVPLPQGSRSADHGLLCVNHEYTNTEVMLPGLVPQGQERIDWSRYTREMAEVEMAAHGASIVEVKRGADGAWAYVRGSKYNRRVSALDTVFEMVGPAAGHNRLKTSADPTGRRVIGMFNNCAGGITPWGTYLSGEENIDGYFVGKIDQSHPEQRSHDRMGLPSGRNPWGRFFDRFDVNKEPQEPLRYGWVCEIDPYDPAAMPRKLTALGRFKHEGATPVVNGDGRVVVYMGDDQRFEHVYRFVSKGRYDPADRKANMRLLEEGTLFVGRFDADGTLEWLPLVHGQGPLTAENGFRDQGDVLIDARIAATLVGATRMDRPEDVEVHPRTGKVYVTLTNNEDRRPEGANPLSAVNAANPRPANIWGQIVEMIPPGGDHAAARFTWELLVKAGNPEKPETGASFNPATSANGWFACPDNLASDGQGRLWVGTDQGWGWIRASGGADGLYGMETEGPLRGTARLFFQTPVGAELTGPCFTPDDRTLFVAVQHPGVDNVEKFTASGLSATFEDPGSRWPDFDEKMPPRPSVVVITKAGGGIVGT
ncbi:MAG TPA: PhoX family phosphatase [Azospirillaceae bacterium]|nr:PhoX family phosphatase [Azospirillaceae bacterium]